MIRELHRLLTVLQLLQITLGVNHFGLVYLTLHLLEVVRATAKKGPTARIVWVTSLGSQLVNPPVIGATTKRPGIDYLDWEDLKSVPYPLLISH